MNINNLYKIIEQGECTTTEFKVQTPAIPKIAKTLCAFANTHGGFLVVGINDNGTIEGIKNILRETEKIQVAAKNFVIPFLQNITIEHIKVNNVTILLVHIPVSVQKPHVAITATNAEIMYIRNGKESIEAGKTMQKIIQKNYISSNIPPQLPTTQLCSKQTGVLEYLSHHPRITVKGFMQLMNLSKRRAYRLLTNLVLNDFLVLHENSKENFYTLK